MVDKARSGATTTRERISDETLETGKLLIEFLHATYATRRQRADAEEAAAEGGSPLATGATARTPMSAHAVRAAIHIYQHGDRTVGQIAGGLGISYGWASRVVDELEAAHHIVRERDEADRRVVRVRLDPESRAEVERAYAWRAEAVQRALEPLTDEERSAVRMFLRRLVDSLREADPEADGSPEPSGPVPPEPSEPVQSTQTPQSSH
jgi:DNA-binding MarR family transcriptional regulator